MVVWRGGIKKRRRHSESSWSPDQSQACSTRLIKRTKNARRFPKYKHTHMMICGDLWPYKVFFSPPVRSFMADFGAVWQFSAFWWPWPLTHSPQNVTAPRHWCKKKNQDYLTNKRRQSHDLLGDADNVLEEVEPGPRSSGHVTQTGFKLGGSGHDSTKARWNRSEAFSSGLFVSILAVKLKQTSAWKFDVDPNGPPFLLFVCF